MSRRIKKMDDTGGNYVASGIYRHQFRLFILLNPNEIGVDYIAGVAQLPVRVVGYGQGIWVVFWCLSLSFPSLHHQQMGSSSEAAEYAAFEKKVKQTIYLDNHSALSNFV